MENFKIQKDTFFKELERIESKYSDFFKNRPHQLDSSLPDVLSNHYAIIEDYSTKKIRFTIISEELPYSIKVECIEAFEKIFPK